MRIPFYTILGPSIRRNRYFLSQFCSHPLLLVSGLYTGMLGILGMALSVVDLLMVLKCGSTLPGYMKSRPCKPTNRLVSPELERDLKIIGLLLSFEYYSSLVLGVLTRNPIFFLPFLFFYVLIILLQCANLVLSIFSDGLGFAKSCLFTAMFVVYNWFTVLCCFMSCIHGCDY